MARFLLVAAAVALAAAAGAQAFLVGGPVQTRAASRRGAAALAMKASSNSGGMIERRGALQSVGQVLGLSALALAVAPARRAEAAVGEGGLPEVTEAFQRVVRGQREWGKVGKTIADREGQLGDDEWVNTQIFLRNNYMVGEDMRRVVRDADAEKRTQGTAIAKEFQRLTLDMDKPAKAKDFKAFLAQHAQGAKLYQDFLDVLSDVPDEL